MNHFRFNLLGQSIKVPEINLPAAKSKKIGNPLGVVYDKRKTPRAHFEPREAPIPFFCGGQPSGVAPTVLPQDHQLAHFTVDDLAVVALDKGRL